MPEEWTRDELVQRWRGFLAIHAEPQLGEVLNRYPELRSLNFTYYDIERHDEALALQVLHRPQTALYAAEIALAQMVAGDHRRPRGECKVHFRVRGLPKSREVAVEIRDLRAKHLGMLVAIPCLVKRVSDVRPRVQEAVFQCERCHAVIQEPQEGKMLQEPVQCYEDQSGCGRAAASTRFKLLEERSQVIDFQRIDIQEPPEHSVSGSPPLRFSGDAMDDLTGTVLPGERIYLNGILRAAPKGEGLRRRSILDIYLEVVSVDATREEEEFPLTPAEVEEIEALAKRPGIIERLGKSIAPTLFELDVEKLAIALALFGGVPKRMPDGTHMRGDIHILLLGDPSTGKSQLLNFVREIAPRQIFAAGKGASAAGLTAAVVKDEDSDGRFTLEAGALVLANGGIALIDEIDKMRPDDRSAMHEAMEQQRVSITKAGISATLPARCSIIGAANPKTGKFDESKLVIDQIDLPIPLLHRFDAIFIFRDKPDGGARDSKLAQHILRMHQIGQQTERTGVASEEAGGAPLSTRLLKRYIFYAKKQSPPVMTDEAMKAIQKFFLDKRKEEAGAEGRTSLISTRHLEGLVRFAEASARARLSQVVDNDDVARSIRIFEHWAHAIGGTGGDKYDLNIMYGGYTSTMKEEMGRLMDLIRECDVRGKGADKRLVMERAVRDLKMRADRVNYLVEKLYSEGSIYERDDDHWRVA
jgi:replicative DNA helicase Mcm